LIGSEYNKKVICVQDDLSRCILAIGEFDHATGKNSINILKEALLVAESVNGTILAINTDRGSQFYANKKGKKGKGKLIPEILRKKRNPPHTLTEKQSSNEW
jgi:hypothetical protein